MKKICTMLVMAMMALAFTSCDDDESIAYTLEGTWKGNMYISSEWGGRYYNATYSEVTFLKDPYRYSSGSGYWVDYYSNAPWDYVANHIEWTVELGAIRVFFREEGTMIDIRNYRLDYDHFVGTIYDNGSMVDFDLRNVNRPYYDNYRWGYDSWYDNNYYWARTRTAGDESTVTVGKPKRVIRPAKE